MKNYISAALLASVTMFSMVNADDAITENENSNVEVLSNIKVVDESIYRERTNSIKPVLAYDSRFFDKYEPRTVGEMLRFLPGVAFQGDVGEYDFVKLRGLSSAYTQILINGNRIPGTEADGSASLDLIPAEMVERIEILRSPSASNDSSGIAGTINIILKEASSASKFSYRLGTAYYSNGKAGSNVKKDQMDGGAAGNLYGDTSVTEDKFKGLAYLSYTDMIGETAFTFSANIDDKYTPKDKVTIVRNSDRELDSYENEYDNRDTLTTSLYAKAVMPLFNNHDEFTIASTYFTIDRKEEQREISYENYDATTGLWEFDEVQHQVMDINKDAFNLQLEYVYNLNNHKIKFYNAFDKLDYSLHDYEAKKGTNVSEINDINSWTGKKADDEVTKTKDTQYNTKLTDTYQVTDSTVLDYGFDYMNKNRNTDFFVNDALADKGTYKVIQNRIDLYVEGNYQIDDVQRVGAGVRMENTQNKSTSQAGVESSNSYTTFNPSVHYMATITDYDLVRASFAQTVRRPSLDEIVPFQQEDEPKEFDKLIGNPDLKPEKSLGMDLGYEHTFKEAGLFGLNAYYRSITDVIEYSPTGNTTDFGDENGKEYVVTNNGDAIVYGVELDLSVPLAIISLPEVSLFANYSYLGSEVTDFFTGEKRRFNDQPDYVYNIGLSHDIKNLGFSYGFNYQQRGKSTAEAADETEETTYGAEVELFAQYEASKNMMIRFTVDNALNSAVDESFTTYKNVTDKINGDVDAYETQSEKAGARYMIVLSGSF